MFELGWHRNMNFHFVGFFNSERSLKVPLKYYKQAYNHGLRILGTQESDPFM